MPANPVNLQINRSLQRWHYRQLVETLRLIVSGQMRGIVAAAALQDCASRAIAVGLPIDPSVMEATDFVLETQAYYCALCIPQLREYHDRCRAWLAVKLRRPEGAIHGDIAWNLTLGGEVPEEALRAIGWTEQRREAARMRAQGRVLIARG